MILNQRRMLVPLKGSTWVVILSSDILFTGILTQWNSPFLKNCPPFFRLLHIVAWAAKDIQFYFEILDYGSLSDYKKDFFQVLHTMTIIIYSQLMSTYSELLRWNIRTLFYSIIFPSIFQLQPFLYLLSILCFTCVKGII